MSNERNWGYKALNIENSINNSKQTIRLFERSIAYAEEKNEASYIKINEWEKQFQILDQDFYDLNGIHFKEAQEYVDKSNNPDEEFNLEQYKKLESLRDKIDGEKFFIYQRDKIIEKNKKIIEDIVGWIEIQKRSIV